MRSPPCRIPPASRASASALEGAPIDQRTDERSCLAEIADYYPPVDLGEPGHQPVIDILMHKEPTQGGAALAGRAHGGEGDGPDCQIEIGRGRDDGAVIATELEDRARETGGEPRTNGAAHGGRTRSGNEGDPAVVDENLTHVPAADHYGGQTG